MQNIRSADTQIEIKVRSALHKKGFRFRKNDGRLIGRPDITLPKYKLVIFLDSCFWHMCPYHYNIPQTNSTYWIPKLERNKNRAKEVNHKLIKDGWLVLRFWEHQVKSDLNSVIKKISITAKKNLHFDQVLPYSKGGTSFSAANVRILCAKHNLQKSDKILSFPPILLRRTSISFLDS